MTRRSSKRCCPLLLLCVSLVLAAHGRADEGMWLFNNLPADKIKNKYDITPTRAWAEHLMSASVRFNVGGSASFVSSRGLVLTNHHVGADTLHKLSTQDHNLFEEGFLARTATQELLAPDLELNQLVSIKDVTETVKNAIEPGMSAAEALAARRAVIATLENEASEATGNRCNVITLYGGGRYDLYEYKKYTDVRLVWAPEASAAFFGGDADNFEYPRYCLDACLFRVYENDQPAHIDRFLKWNDEGLEEGEPVFVSGNPGSTSRIFTNAALRYERDQNFPYLLDFIRRREILLQQFGNEGPEQKRRAEDELFSFQNMRKAYMGMLAGLQDPDFLTSHAKKEERLLEKIHADSDLGQYAEAWETIAEVQQKRAALVDDLFSLNTRIFNLGQSLVRLAAEDQKPNEERLPEFRDSNRDSLRRELLSPAPIYLDLEQVKLADLIGRTLEIRGADDPLCRTLLDGKSPQSRAAQLVQHTQLANLDYRTMLADGGPATIDACDDPIIQLARALDPEIRRVKQASDELDEIEQQSYAKIAEVLFKIEGTSVYPDATFTLRLAYGQIKGYEEEGRDVPAWTTLAGAFDHELAHDGKEPWRLPKSWHQARRRLRLVTPLNFVCTADIIGGNSGSPVVNEDLELVGLIFDGNVQSLTSDFFYSDKQGRAISVSAGAIREALREIYNAEHLADELGQ